MSQEEKALSMAGNNRFVPQPKIQVVAEEYISTEKKKQLVKKGLQVLKELLDSDDEKIRLDAVKEVFKISGVSDKRPSSQKNTAINIEEMIINAHKEKTKIED